MGISGSCLSGDERSIWGPTFLDAKEFGRESLAHKCALVVVSKNLIKKDSKITQEISRNLFSTAIALQLLNDHLFADLMSATSPPFEYLPLISFLSTIPQHRFLSDRSLQVLSSSSCCKTLQSLDLSSFGPITVQCLLPTLDSLVKHSLRHLSLAWMREKETIAASNLIETASTPTTKTAIGDPPLENQQVIKQLNQQSIDEIASVLSFGRIHSLSLRGTCLKSLEKLVKCLPLLELLDVSDTQLDELELLRLCCEAPPLKGLFISDVPGLTNATFSALISRFGLNLTMLDIRTTDQKLTNHILLKSCVNLRGLLCSPSIDNEPENLCEQIIPFLPKLEHLDWKRPESLRILKTVIDCCPEMRVLRLYFSENDSPTLSEISVGSIKKLEHLFSLRVMGCFPSEQAKLLSELHTFAWHDSHNVTQTAIEAIAQGCNTHLRCIDLHETTPTEQSIISVGDFCKHLQIINLGNCHLTDNAVERLLAGKGSVLELNFSTNNLLTDRTAIAIAKNCTFLNILKLSKTEVSDIGISEIAKGCKFLLSLDLCECPNVTIASVNALMNSCKDLMEVNFPSGINIDPLREACKQRDPESHVATHNESTCTVQ